MLYQLHEFIAQRKVNALGINFIYNHPYARKLIKLIFCPGSKSIYLSGKSIEKSNDSAPLGFTLF